MRQDAANVQGSFFEMYHSNQSEMIAGNVENIPVVADKIGGRKDILHVRKFAPVGLFGFFIPFIQWIGTFGVSADKILDNRS
jgi:hypothetical protein